MKSGLEGGEGRRRERREGEKEKNVKQGKE